jgi:hypothetical protein
MSGHTPESYCTDCHQAFNLAQGVYLCPLHASAPDLLAERDMLTTKLAGANAVIFQAGRVHGETLRKLDRLRALRAALQRCAPSLAAALWGAP